MKKIILIAIPSAMILLFVITMNATPFFKNTIDETVKGEIHRLEQDVTDGNWNGMVDKVTQLENRMKSIYPFIQFSVERDNMNRLDLALYKLKGSLLMQDRGLSSAYLREAAYEWDNLGD